MFKLVVNELVRRQSHGAGAQCIIKQRAHLIDLVSGCRSIQRILAQDAEAHRDVTTEGGEVHRHYPAAAAPAVMTPLREPN